MLRPGGLIPQAFYLRPVETVARALLGQFLVHEGVVLRITEVEAYGGPEDSASHCRSGRTARNAPMWAAGGCAYVFACYGLHRMLNLVTGPEGEGAAVLIRGAEVVAGEALVAARRGRNGPLDGPAKLAQALGVGLDLNGHRLHEAGGLELREGPAASRVLSGPRIGIPYASPIDQEARLRFADAECPKLGHRRHFDRPESVASK